MSTFTLLLRILQAFSRLSASSQIVPLNFRSQNWVQRVLGQSEWFFFQMSLVILLLIIPSSVIRSVLLLSF